MYKFNDSFFENEYNRYLEIKDKGLKKQANKILENLMLYFDNLDTEIKNAICEEFCILRFEKEVIQDFQFFLSTRILEFLRDACLQNIMPHLRWYYQMTGDFELLEKTYNHLGCDDETIKSMCNYYLNYLWHGSHHFPEYCLIEKEESCDLLRKVQTLIQKHGSILKEETEDYLHFEQIYGDWWTYKYENPNYSFDEWCIEHNRKYSWVAAYYYETK